MTFNNLARNGFFLALLGGGLLSCQKKDEPNKILDPLPLNSTQTCVPGQLGQAWFVMKRDCLKVLIPVINLTTIPNSSFPQVSGPDAMSQYTFQTSGDRYGTATYTIRFYNESGVVIDPILTNTSTSTLKSITVQVVGGSSKVTYTEALTLTFETAGLLSSHLRLTGTSSISDNPVTNTLNFTFSLPGPRVAFEGLIDGEVTATGTGPNSQTTALNLTFYADHTANGSIAWEDLSGGIHYQDNGVGYVVTNLFRLLLE
ncbi:MAG: hypothetical protein KCHDKBKB_02168 [Elusimicrobia bacterium]|nr:hypothetical protein [Elusimicrobiota bacterium]